MKPEPRNETAPVFLVVLILSGAAGTMLAALALILGAGFWLAGACLYGPVALCLAMLWRRRGPRPAPPAIAIPDPQSHAN